MCKWYNRVFIFLFLTFLVSLSMIISRSIHVAANGIISFFLWLSNIPLQIADSLESPFSWERLRAEGEEDVRGWDGWMASPMQWTWTCTNSRRWCGTGRPGVLQSMVLQRGGHDWATEQQQQQYSVVCVYHNFFIHSSVNGCLGCFHILAIVNIAAMNIGVYVSFLIS